LPTVREAACVVLDHGGKLEAQDGNLIVLLPDLLTEVGIGDLGARNVVYPAVRPANAARRCSSALGHWPGAETARNGYADERT
jgi:hypothetical protein